MAEDDRLSGAPVLVIDVDVSSVLFSDCDVWHWVPFDVVQRKFSSASVVSFGRSSEIQWPVSLNTTTLTSLATSFICSASSLPNDLSPPIDNTGIVNFVCEICAKSLASCGHEAK